MRFGPEAASREDRAKAHRAVTHDDDRGARRDPGGDGAVVTRAHHVAERRDGGRQPVVGQVGVAGEQHEGAVCERRAYRLALATVVFAAPVPAVAARRLEPFGAVVAGPVGEGERGDHAIARPDRSHVRPDRLDHADELVAGATGPAGDLERSAVGPEVAAAHAGVGYPHQRIGGRLQRRVGDILHPDVAWPVVHARPHSHSP